LEFREIASLESIRAPLAAVPSTIDETTDQMTLQSALSNEFLPLTRVSGFCTSMSDSYEL
jgi:hypothetical protein